MNSLSPIINSTCYKRIYENQKTHYKLMKNAKETGTNEHLYSKLLQPFLKWTETKYEMKTKCVLINKD